MPEFVFLSNEDLLLIHADAIEKDGGLAGVRDQGLLEAAVAMPRQQFGGEYLHEDLAAMAAAYLYHIAQNRAFHDGNKRAAVMAAYVFLDNNGVELSIPPKQLESVTMQVAGSEMSKEELTTWLREQIGENG